MKYYYKVIKLVNNQQKSLVYISKNFKKSEKKFYDTLTEYKDIIVSKNYIFKDNEYVIRKNSIILMTNNPYMSHLNMKNNHNAFILKYVDYYEPRKFYCYPFKKYLSLEEILLQKNNDIFYTYLNKIVIEGKNPTMIICKNLNELNSIISFIIEKSDLIYMGAISKKNRKKYKSHILNIFNITENTLYKTKIT